MMDNQPSRDELLLRRFKSIEKQATEEKAAETARLEQKEFERARNGLNCKYSSPDDYRPLQCHHPLLRGFKDSCVCVGMDFGHTFNYEPDEDAVKLCGDDRLLSEYRKSWKLLLGIMALMVSVIHYIHFLVFYAALLKPIFVPDDLTLFNAMYSIAGWIIPLIIVTTLGSYHDTYFKNMTWEEKLSNIW